MGRVPHETEAQIKESMMNAMKEYWSDANLLELASGFIDYQYKEGFTFSALTQVNFHMISNRRDQTFIHRLAAVEILILALDIFDDLQDQDTEDRPWTQSPSASTMNIATGFLLLSVSIIERSNMDESCKWKIIPYINQQVLKAVQGQHQDLSTDIQSENEYLQMIRRKSGSLMACASLVGAASASKEHQEIIYQYSEYLGMAAQLANDLKDVTRVDGKNDLFNKKKTLPIIQLLSEDCIEARWVRDYFDEKVTCEFIVANKLPLFSWIEKSSALKYTQVMKRLYQLKALREIESLEVADHWKSELTTMVEEF
ncbi:polyprenyl synthetase family protein [Halobacillus rhizosphaerae]|uniref:polyprenyl synthetase family protein n=1 Tax=Halobacillus rhizosphaerae TaxID=3064889 RepID=UPI00398ACDCF